MGDSGYYLYRIVNGPFILEILHPMGHPLFQFVSKFSYAVFGVNGILVFNTLCLFFSLLVLSKIANRISTNRIPDYRFILGFMVLHSVVWTSTHIEVYQFHLLLVLLGLFFLFDPKENSFWIAGLFWGLSLSVHQMTILVIPILLYWVF